MEKNLSEKSKNGQRLFFSGSLVLIALFALAGFGLSLTSSFSESMDSAEIESFHISGKAYIPLVWDAARNNGHSPLYYLILHVVMKYGEDEFSLRLSSLVCGLVILIVTALFASYSGDWALGFLCAGAVAWFPQNLLAFRQAKPEAILAAFSLLSWWTFLRWAAQPEKHGVFPPIILDVLAFFTHKASLVTLGGQFLFLIVFFLFTKRYKRTYKAEQWILIGLVIWSGITLLSFSALFLAQHDLATSVLVAGIPGIVIALAQLNRLISVWFSRISLSLIMCSLAVFSITNESYRSNSNWPVLWQWISKQTDIHDKILVENEAIRHTLRFYNRQSPRRIIKSLPTKNRQRQINWEQYFNTMNLKSGEQLVFVSDASQNGKNEASGQVINKLQSYYRTITKEYFTQQNSSWAIRLDIFRSQQRE